MERLLLITRVCCLALTALTSSVFAETPVFSLDTKVKESQSGFCHPVGTRYYDQTTKPVKRVSGDVAKGIAGPGDFETLRQCMSHGNAVYEPYRDYYTALLTADGKDCEAADAAAAECRLLRESGQQANKKLDELDRFENFGFGIALAAIDFDQSVVDDVAIVDGHVRVGESRDIATTVLFESHYFWTIPGLSERIGYGPFVAASLASEAGVNPLSTFAVGGMIGFKRRNTAGSFNIGIGYAVDTDASVLRSGISDGMATDEMDSANLVRKTDVGGLLLMFSATW